MRLIFRILPVLSVTAVGAVLWADSQQNATNRAGSLSPIAAIARADVAGLPNGNELFAACESRLLAHRSVSAQVRQRVQLFDRQLFGSGIYLQQGISGQPGITGGRASIDGIGEARNTAREGRLQFRFELDFQLEDRKRGIVQSSDGVTLWLYDSNAGDDALRKIDLDRFALTVERYEMEAGRGAGETLAAQGAETHGGLPRLLADLRTNFQFQTVGETEIAGVAVWVLQGAWRSDRLQQLAQQSKEESSSGQQNVEITQFGPHVPHDVLLYLDRDELFPYRIQYRRLEKVNKESAPQPRTLVEMELFQVRFDAPIELNQFAKPVDISAVDYTDSFAQRLVQDDGE